MSASQLFACKPGALGGGNDLAQGEHTVEEAARRCIELGECSPSFPPISAENCNAPCLGDVSQARRVSPSKGASRTRTAVCCATSRGPLSRARMLSPSPPYPLTRACTHTLTHALTNSVCVQLRSGECRPELADVHATHDAQGRRAWRRQRRGIGTVYAGGSVPAVLKPATGCWLHVPRESEPAGEADVLL
eukprot:COSAG03_NODE_2773_length_2459_cov_12.603390_3_plen_191_part_00